MAASQIAVVNTNGEIVIAEDIRLQCDLLPGTRFVVRKVPEGILLTPLDKYMREARGILRKTPRLPGTENVSLDDLLQQERRADKKREDERGW